MLLLVFFLVRFKLQVYFDTVHMFWVLSVTFTENLRADKVLDVVCLCVFFFFLPKPGWWCGKKFWIGFISTLCPTALYNSLITMTLQAAAMANIQDLTNRPVDKAKAYWMEVGTEESKIMTSSTSDIGADTSLVQIILKLLGNFGLI